jgi:ATP-dependent Lon protease
VVIPLENKKDLEEVPVNVLKSLNMVFVDHVDEVLDVAFVKPKVDDDAARDMGITVN